MIRGFVSSLGFKVGLAIVLVEAATLLMLGTIYIHRFSAQVDSQLLEDLAKPAALLSQGVLKPEALSYRDTMESLVSPGIRDAMIIGVNGNIFHSLDPAWIGRNFAQVPGVQLAWLAESRRAPLQRIVAEGTNSFRLHLTPVATAPDRAPFLFCYLKARTTEAEQAKAVIVGRFLWGSVAGIVATSLAILLCFRWLIASRLGRVVEAVLRFRQGDYSTRVEAPESPDQIGLLQAGFNAMAAQLEGTIATLKHSVADLKAAEAARRENEENFRRLFEGAPIAMALTQPDGRVLMLNQAAAGLLEITPAEAMSRPALSFYGDPADRPRVLEQVSAQGRAEQYEISVRTGAGALKWVSLSVFPLEHHGQPALLSGMVDLTERRRAEQERLDWERKLQQTQKLESLGVLAGGIAHDFNNLLTGILGHASLAISDLPPWSPLREPLQQIETSSLRAAELCKQMLAYAGKGQFCLQLVDLSTLVAETTHLLQISISKRAQLRFELAGRVPRVKGDATQIRQVIMNLVINASDALGEKDGLIVARTGRAHMEAAELATLSHGAALEPGEYVFLEIADTGCGMAPEVVARIFDPFFTTKFTGRGLGLAAVLGIVRGHKGALQVKSQPGQGTSFRMLLPAVTEAPAAPAGAAPKLAGWRGSGELLLVDDEQVVRHVAAQMLGMLGFQVTQAADGREGLDHYRARPGAFAIVVLDLTMPQLDGREALAEIRAIDPGARVLLVSGFDEHDLQDGVASGQHTAFLQKPYSLAELTAKLQSLLAETS